MHQVGGMIEGRRRRVLVRDPAHIDIDRLRRLNDVVARRMGHMVHHVLHWLHELQRASQAGTNRWEGGVADGLNEVYTRLGTGLQMLRRWESVVEGDLGRREDEAWWRRQNAILEGFPDWYEHISEGVLGFQEEYLAHDRMQPAPNRRQQQEATDDGDSVATQESDESDDDSEFDDDGESDDDEESDDEADTVPAAAPPTPIGHDWSVHTWSRPSIGQAQPSPDNAEPAEDWSNAISGAAEQQEQEQQEQQQQQPEHEHQLAQAPVEAAPGSSNPSTPASSGLAAVARGALAWMRPVWIQPGRPVVPGLTFAQVLSQPNVPPCEAPAAPPRETEPVEGETDETEEAAAAEEAEEESDWSEQFRAEQERLERRQEGPKL
ncbi:hypothetical protein PG991_012019 [Apiospora marii]|uniref:Uncharacterized protein n=1 Tax=Apiospora marii TaxID=335849 RepID=A0ABR1RGY2_9PEZI